MSTAPDPGERRLARPPSERYGALGDEAGSSVPRSSGSAARGLLYATLATLSGVILTVLLGGIMALSAGLLVVWASAGNAIGLALRLGAGPALRPPARPAIAAGLALVGVALGQLGLWWYAGTEGGVLPLVPYLLETYGILVPLEAVLAAGFAWWAAR